MAPIRISSDPNVGGRVRAFRKARDLTIDEVAESSGVTKSFISRFERNEVQASVATLLKIFAIIGIKMSDVFDPSPSSYVPSGEGVPVNYGGHNVREFVVSGPQNDSLMALLSIVEPGGGSGPELYMLDAAADLVHVLEGELTVTVGSEIYHLKQGDTLNFAASIPHSWVNPSHSKDSKVLWVMVPPPK
ncbi:cupin domain-containing protein [Brucella pseudogrignonensis]|uniref:cupin domain-containing protein n=1 Tax=Brucella pseudogrignonensis TaxID=419475 RepID=UPI003ED14486